jgi:hypothetical protein
LREFTIGSYLLLQKLGNPLVAAQPGEIKLTDLQVLELLFVLSRPAREASEALSRGREAFEADVLEFAEGIPLGAMPQFEAAVKTLMERASATAPTAPQSEKKTAAHLSSKSAARG